ncbi:MAG TPA: rhodanese-like domain-containing protein [Streptosporangiaceae bacterium]
MGIAGTRLVPLLDEGLGNCAYLVDLGDGRALAVDASCDVRALRAAAGRRNLRVAFAAETHLHADFVSGVRQLAATDGATVLASAAGRRAFDHVRLDDLDEVDLGGLTLRALATPGHTDEHLSYLLLDGRSPLGVFTGGSLIVGAVARTDLVDPARTEELARAQYRSVRRLAELPDEVEVWPTHGAGSFCAAPAGGRRTSTIGAEKAANPLLAAPDADAFAHRLIEGLGSFPAYFRRLGEVNRAGPSVRDAALRLGRLDAPRALVALAEGAVVVDVRPVDDFMAGHVAGAVSIPLRPQFATWLGWLIDPRTPVVIVRDPTQDPEEICWQAMKIGHDVILGELSLADWRAAGGPIMALPLVRPDEVDPGLVVDVRQDAEYATGHLPGAVHIELGDLADLAVHAADIGIAGVLAPDRLWVVMCGHGERAATAASLLARAGHPRVAVMAGGPGDWARATGRRLREGG